MGPHSKPFDELTPGNFAERIKSASSTPGVWLVTGAAGFIGSHLVETLLSLGQTVRGLDNFSTGRKSNLVDVEARVGQEAYRNFHLITGDVRDKSVCQDACREVDFVLHHAALVSVPFSLANPELATAVNVVGFLNILEAARAEKVRKVVYASSSAVYGESSRSSNRESQTPNPLSPYALTKAVNEDYAALYQHAYNLPCTGLRYFNVFGRRQDPRGAYAAVIPSWAELIAKRIPCRVFGDGTATRDFCHVSDVVQANLLSATTEGLSDPVFNVGSGEERSLLELHRYLYSTAASIVPSITYTAPQHEAPRGGDIRHSVADISLIRNGLGFKPSASFSSDLETVFDGLLEVQKRQPDVHRRRLQSRVPQLQQFDN